MENKSQTKTKIQQKLRRKYIFMKMGIGKDYHCGNISIIKCILDIKMMSFYI